VSGFTPYFHDERFLEEYEANSESTRYAVISDAWDELDYVEAQTWIHAFELWLLDVRGWHGYTEFWGRACPDEPFNEIGFSDEQVIHRALIVPAEALEGGGD
jgi:hypothetical protein